MPTVKNVGEPCAGEPHARFDGGREETRASRQRRAAQAPPVYPTTLASSAEGAQPPACRAKGDFGSQGGCVSELL